MRKFFSLIFLLVGVVMSAGAQVTEYSGIGLKFYRSGTDASSVSVSVVDENGTAISGAAATLTSSHSFMATTGNVTDSILCPNVNGNTSPTIVLTFEITGLPSSIPVNTASLDIHALNSAGTYQSPSDAKVRQFCVDVARGASADAVSSMVSWTDIDIAEGIGSTGDVHQVWSLTSSSVGTVGETLVVQLTITAGSTNVGCFFGLSYIGLSYATLSEDNTYTIRCYSNDTYYMTEEDEGGLVVSTKDLTQRQFWKFIPTGNENCFYIYNTASGNYIQTCRKAASSRSTISTGTTPVEYYAAQVLDETSALNGCYRLTSTDCSNYADTSATPVGLSKDGSSTNVITWRAGLSNSNSFWVIEATDDVFELQPFDVSEAVGTPTYEYSICSTSGQALEMAADGTLSWQDRAETAAQHWYFVGTSNNTTGYLIANTGTGRTINLDGADSTYWYVIQNFDVEGTYFFRPFETYSERGTALTIEGDSLMIFRSARSTYARNVQIYTLPCGTLGSTYVTHATIDGTGALLTMTYPLSTLSGTTVSESTASKPSSWYTLYTEDKATLAIGSNFDLHLTLNAAPATGEAIYACFDWNRDGVFEEVRELTAAQTVDENITVPADATAGKTRVRLRITSNGLTDPEDDVTGQILEFVVNLSDEEVPATPVITVSVNDTARGTAAVVAENGEATVTATPSGNATFVSWCEGNNILSADATYSFSYTRSMNLTAYFSPKTSDEVDGIDTATLTEESAIVNVSGDRHTITIETDRDVRLVQVFSSHGALLASSASKVVSSPALQPGTYVVKVYTADKNVAQKVLVK